MELLLINSLIKVRLDNLLFLFSILPFYLSLYLRYHIWRECVNSILLSFSLRKSSKLYLSILKSHIVKPSAKAFLSFKSISVITFSQCPKSSLYFCICIYRIYICSPTIRIKRISLISKPFISSSLCNVISLLLAEDFISSL